MTTITLGGETLTISDELLQKIKDEQKPKNKKWMPKEGETVYLVCGNGEVLNVEHEESLIASCYTHNNVYPTRKEAEKAVLRMESAERRYLPEYGEEYKTLASGGHLTKFRWYDDFDDTFRYHSGMVWHEDTPDEEILEWRNKYWDAWSVTK